MFYNCRNNANFTIILDAIVEPQTKIYYHNQKERDSLKQ